MNEANAQEVVGKLLHNEGSSAKWNDLDTLKLFKYLVKLELLG